MDSEDLYEGKRKRSLFYSQGAPLEMKVYRLAALRTILAGLTFLTLLAILILK